MIYELRVYRLVPGRMKARAAGHDAAEALHDAEVDFTGGGHFPCARIAHAYAEKEDAHANAFTPAAALATGAVQASGNAMR